MQCCTYAPLSSNLVMSGAFRAGGGGGGGPASCDALVLIDVLFIIIGATSIFELAVYKSAYSQNSNKNIQLKLIYNYSTLTKLFGEIYLYF